MPLTRQPKKNLNITDLESYAIASEELIDAKLEAFETCIEEKLCAHFAEFSLGRPPSPRRSQQGESSDRREDFQEKGAPMTDPPYPRMTVDFPRCEVQTRSQTAGAAHEERGSERDEREVRDSPRAEEAQSGAPTGKRSHKGRLSTMETHLDVLEASLEELYQG
ncbi:hypothetical protein BHE74_00001768 [Ensete ventricosum]|nr:hypothetical protein BHE74_00001768 [Ensete ventricosum]RZR90036.1 hypothetical protein BHM03_00017857 [Ensete ventricosum]